METLNRKLILLIPVSAVLFVLFFIGGPGYHSSRSYQHFWDLGHIFFFAILTFLLLSLWQTLAKKSFPGQCIRIVLITLILGTAIEIFQYGFSRTPDAGDMVRNLIGSSLALFFGAPLRKTIPAKKLRILQLLTALIFMVGLLPLSIALTDEWTAKKQFPVLSDFETPFERYRWRGEAVYSIDHGIAYHGKSSLKVQLDTTEYSGVGLTYFPRDWQNYEALTISVYNPASKPIKITCRVHDRRHTEGPQLYSDRFNKSYVLDKGWNIIKINLEEIANAPKTRQMNISQIYNLGIFAVQLPEPRIIFIDNVRLIK
jgi:VanZ family protein